MNRPAFLSWPAVRLLALAAPVAAGLAMAAAPPPGTPPAATTFTYTGAEQTYPITGPDLALTDTAPPTAVSGEPYQYTLTATNTGGQDATGVTVTDTLPATAHFDTASVTAGKCTHTPSTAPATDGGTVSCTAASLTAGASMTVTIKVTATTLGTVSAAAKATASNVTDDTDDSGTASTTVHGTWQ